jgi:hypothetical protein
VRDGSLRPGRDRGTWRARTIAGVLAVALVVAGTGTLGVETLRVLWAEGDAPLAHGTVVALGGSPERVTAALALARPPDGPPRLLLLSSSAADDYARDGGSCDEPLVRCVTPEPDTTRGEALLLRRLADSGELGEGVPGGLTVVTSGWHVHRARLHLRACLDRPGPVPFVVVAAGPATGSVALRLLHEALGSLDARLRPECGAGLLDTGPVAAAGPTSAARRG